MAYVVLDPRDSTARIALAGHPPPVLVVPTPRLLEHTGSLPLGLQHAEYEEYRVALPPASRLVLYSDGVIEAEKPGGEQYGSERIEQHFADPSASPQSLLDDVRRFTGSSPLEDARAQEPYHGRLLHQ